MTEFAELNYVIQALIATLFTYALTAAGAATVFFIRKWPESFFNAIIGCSAGIMTAASFYSLLLPAQNMAQDMGMKSWIIVAAGFLTGSAFLFAADRYFACKLCKSFPSNSFRDRKKSAMLMLSITLHNIPEGLSVGVAFASIALGFEQTSLAAAMMLALSIGIQNFPEGVAVSAPLISEGMPRSKAFFYGQLSAAVEPLAGVLGALLCSVTRKILPFMLSFAAGAMIYVVMGELLPDNGRCGKKEIYVLCFITGFLIMTILDTAFA